MRFADGPSAHGEIHIDAPPERVWPLVSDITVPPLFSAELQEVQWASDPAGPRPGARFTGRNEHPARGTWHTTSVIAECEPCRCFAWNVETPTGYAASWRFDLEPDGTGTRLRQEGRMGPAPSRVTELIAAMPDREEKIIARRLAEWQRNIDATLAGIKQLAEAPAEHLAR
ncbi:MAG: SRPBCC family protein [Streptosporangiaceae bacterium]